MGNKPIVHAPIATGSTEPRDIRDRFADFVNLKDFGAVGDGVTDDSSAWAAWQTALQNGGMPYIPKGDYLLGEEILHAPKGHIGRNANSFSYEDDGPVFNEFDAIVYVDGTNGNDVNDGMTSATAFQTFEKALDAGVKMPNCRIIIRAAAGTYSGDIICSADRFVHIYASGDITINGRVHVDLNSSLIVTGTNLTVNGRVEIHKGSYAYFNCAAAYITPPSEYGLSIDAGSSCEFAGSLALTVLNGRFAIALNKSSQLTVGGQITATVNVSGSAIMIAECSAFTCFAKVLVNSQDSGNNHDNVRATNALYVNDCSFAYIYRLETTNIFSEVTCVSDNCSSLILSNGAYLHGPKRGVATSACLAAIHSSSIRVYSNDGGRTDCITHYSSNSVAVFSAFGSNLTIYGSILVDTYNYGTGSGSASGAFLSQYSSFLAFATGSNNVIYTLSSINAGFVFKADYSAVITIDSNAVFSGNANANANCLKYSVSRCSVLALFGRNSNNLPGPKTGTIATNGVVG